MKPATNPRLLLCSIHYLKLMLHLSACSAIFNRYFWWIAGSGALYVWTVHQQLDIWSQKWERPNVTEWWCCCQNSSSEIWSRSLWAPLCQQGAQIIYRLASNHLPSWFMNSRNCNRLYLCPTLVHNCLTLSLEYAQAHRSLAREVVRKSLVLLKNG